MQEQKLWTKDFITISIINFILMLAMYLLLVTIAPFAVEQYGTSDEHGRSCFGNIHHWNAHCADFFRWLNWKGRRQEDAVHRSSRVHDRDRLLFRIGQYAVAPRK